MLTDFKSDESGRLKALGGLHVLDSGEEQPFEKIVTLVEQILRVPMCAVSLVDKDRQWFKARRGLDACETARDISFCTHAIRGTEPFAIPNALLDGRFANSPLVTGAPHIRSYLGIPLMTPLSRLIDRHYRRSFESASTTTGTISVIWQPRSSKVVTISMKFDPLSRL